MSMLPSPGKNSADAHRETAFCHITSISAEADPGGRSPPLKLTKVSLLTVILYDSENSIHLKGHFVVHCFVTAMLWSILHLLTYSSLLLSRSKHQHCYKPMQRI